MSLTPSTPQRSPAATKVQECLNALAQAVEEEKKEIQENGKTSELPRDYNFNLKKPKEHVITLPNKPEGTFITVVSGENNDDVESLIDDVDMEDSLDVGSTIASQPYDGDSSQVGGIVQVEGLVIPPLDSDERNPKDDSGSSTSAESVEIIEAAVEVQHAGSSKNDIVEIDEEIVAINQAHSQERTGVQTPDPYPEIDETAEYQSNDKLDMSIEIKVDPNPITEEKAEEIGKETNSRFEPEKVSDTRDKHSKKPPKIPNKKLQETIEANSSAKKKPSVEISERSGTPDSKRESATGLGKSIVSRTDTGTRAETPDSKRESSSIATERKSKVSHTPQSVKKELTARQQKLMDESGKMLEYLRNEVMKLRKENSDLRGEFEKLKENNQRLVDANASAGASFKGLNDHAKQLSKTNVRLQQELNEQKKETTKYKSQAKALNLTHMELKEELKMKQDSYKEEVQSRLQYQKTMGKIVDTVQENCRQHRLVEEILAMNDECITTTESLEEPLPGEYMSPENSDPPSPEGFSSRFKNFFNGA